MDRRLTQRAVHVVSPVPGQHPPPYILLGNGAVAGRFLAAMQTRDTLPRLLILNDVSRQRSVAPMRAIVAGHDVPVLEWTKPGQEAVLRIAHETPDVWLLSVYFGHRVGKELLDAVNGRAVNLHPSLLPWCRGTHTNVWPLVERCPAGVTLHAMVPEIDAGPVLIQREVAVKASDTGGTLYRKLEEAALQMLLDSWPQLVLEAWPGEAPTGQSTRHRVADFERVQSYEMPESGPVREFFDLLRARSFPPHRGLRIEVDRGTVEATVELREYPDED